MAIRRCFAAAAALLLTACATAPEPVPPPVVRTNDQPTASLQRAVSDALAADPNAAPEGLVITVVASEPMDGQLVFEARFELPQTWARRAHDYTAYVSCPADKLDLCVAKVIEATGALGRASDR